MRWSEFRVVPLAGGLPHVILKGGWRSYGMGFRAEHWIFAVILLAGLMAGCGSSSTVRPGQTGELVGGEPPRNSVPGYGVIPPAIPLTMFLDHDRAKGIRSTGLPHIPRTPIIVTENAADEEFWEFEYRILAAPTSSMVGKDYSSYVIGSREACEARRLEAVLVPTHGYNP